MKKNSYLLLLILASSCGGNSSQSNSTDGGSSGGGGGGSGGSAPVNSPTPTPIVSSTPTPTPTGSAPPLQSVGTPTDCSGSKCLYVLSTGSGNKSGSDWANALDWNNSLSSSSNSLVRGKTYLFGAGSFKGAHTFNEPESGTSLITIKKATVNDHGSDTGWQASYSSQAVFNDYLWFGKGYYVFDGQTRNESNWQDPSVYGIRVAQVPDGDGIALPGQSSGYPNDRSNITIRYVAIGGAALAMGQVGGDGFGSSGSGGAFGSIVLSHILIFNNAAPLMTRNMDGVLIEYSHIGPNMPYSSGEHCEGITSTNAHDVVIRNNRFVDIQNTAFITVLIGPYITKNWQIYGNLFEHDPNSGWVSDGVGNGVIAIINGNSAVGWRVYNNNIVNVRGYQAGFSFNSTDHVSQIISPSTDNWTYNNIWYHLGQSPQGGSIQGGADADIQDYNFYDFQNGASVPSGIGPHSVTTTENPFVDWTNGVFQLISNSLAVARGFAVTSAPGFATTPLGSSFTSPDSHGVMYSPNLPAFSFPTDNNIDPDGNTRGAHGAWDMGIYQN